MQTVVELPKFVDQAEKLFSVDEHRDLITFLATYPESGDEIPGTGGIRKVRYAAKGKGKRSGARVIYYWYNATIPIYALLVYGKNEKTDLSADEAKIVAAFAKVIKDKARDRAKT